MIHVQTDSTASDDVLATRLQGSLLDSICTWLNLLMYHRLRKRILASSQMQCNAVAVTSLCHHHDHRRCHQHHYHHQHYRNRCMLVNTTSLSSREPWFAGGVSQLANLSNQRVNFVFVTSMSALISFIYAHNSTIFGLHFSLWNPSIYTPTAITPS